MKLNNIEHIFFDLDHTLWDFDKNSGLAFQAIFKENKINVGMDEFMEVYIPINVAYWKRYGENKISQSQLRYGRLKESFDALKIELNDDQINKLSVEYIEHLPRHKFLLAGTLDMLEYLNAKYKLHIITNGFKEVQHKKLNNCGIFQYFKTITTSEDTGVKKPNKLIFEHALKKAKATCSTSVMIGDNFEADILGAQKMGMHTILYNYYKKEFSSNYLQVLKMKEIAYYL